MEAATANGFCALNFTVETVDYSVGNNFFYYLKEKELVPKLKSIPTLQLGAGNMNFNRGGFIINVTYQGEKLGTPVAIKLEPGATAKVYGFAATYCKKVMDNSGGVDIDISSPATGIKWNDLSQYCTQVKSKVKSEDSKSVNSNDFAIPIGDNNNGTSSSSSKKTNTPPARNNAYPHKTSSGKPSSQSSSSAYSSSSPSPSSSRSSASSSGSSGTSTSGFGKEQYNQYNRNLKESHVAFQKAANDFSNAVWANYEAEREAKREERAREEARHAREEAAWERQKQEQAERQRIERERRQAEEKRRTDITNARIQMLKDFRDGKLPLSSDNLDVPTVYCFVYTCDKSLSYNDDPPVYVSNIFPVWKYNDDTWPFKDKVMDDFKKMATSGTAIMIGYFTTAEEASEVLNAFLSTAQDNGYLIKRMSYGGKINSGSGSSDYWGNDTQSDEVKYETDFWGNPIRDAAPTKDSKLGEKKGTTTKSASQKTTTLKKTGNFSEDPKGGVNPDPDKKRTTAEDDYWNK